MNKGRQPRMINSSQCYQAADHIKVGFIGQSTSFIQNFKIFRYMLCWLCLFSYPLPCKGLDWACWLPPLLCWAPLPLASSTGPAAPRWLFCRCFTAVPLRKHSNPAGMKAVWEALFAPGLSVRLSSLRGEPRQYCVCSQIWRRHWVTYLSVLYADFMRLR